MKNLLLKSFTHMCLAVMCLCIAPMISLGNCTADADCLDPLVCISGGCVKLDKPIVLQEFSREKPAVEELLQLFVNSPILGSGSTQFVTTFEILSLKEAVAWIGSDEDRYVFKTRLIKSGGIWGIISYEYIFIPTGEKKLNHCRPPWTKKLLLSLSPA